MGNFFNFKRSYLQGLKMSPERTNALMEILDRHFSIQNTQLLSVTDDRYLEVLNFIYEIHTTYKIEPIYSLTEDKKQFVCIYTHAFDGFIYELQLRFDSMLGDLDNIVRTYNASMRLNIKGKQVV